jgi:hypothetical protein
MIAGVQPEHALEDLRRFASSLESPKAESVPLHAAQEGAVVELVGDVRELHRQAENAGALFQAASQFNLLEMTGPSVTPEQGVGIYEYDATQGPACAIACGGGTIYRNYFVQVASGGERQIGQTADRQVDCLAELHGALGGPGLWQMRNGYALASEVGLEHVNARLAEISEDDRDHLRGLLRIGVQHDVEVLGAGHQVTQVYGAAMPVAYGDPPALLWAPLARLVLEASYEATLLAARESGVKVVYLTLLGGGVFGNHSGWIVDAISRALDKVRGLKTLVVSYKRSSAAVRELVANHVRRT